MADEEVANGEGRWRTFLRRPWLLALIFLLCGLYLVVEGSLLISLGGSPYYAMAGAATFGSAVLLLYGRGEAVSLYAAMLIATLGWALCEVGLDGWQLLPRLAGPFVLGAWLALPVSRRALSPDTSRFGLSRSPVILAVAFAVAAAGGLWLHTLRDAPADPAYERGISTLAEPSLPANAMVGAGKEWPVWGGDEAGTRFSRLDQITPANVGKLEQAWVFRTGIGPQGPLASLKAVPVVIANTAYVCTSVNEVIAIDATTGKAHWRFDPKVAWHGSGYGGACRGVAYYRVPNATGMCATRIIEATIDARMIALDAATGRPCEDFGTHGQISLLTGMGEVKPGYYLVTSAPTIVRGKVVVGGWVADGQYWGEPSGVIRGFDAVTGKLAWAFDAGRLDRQGAPPPGETYTRGTPNSWGMMSADEQLGLVYAPMGNATPDYYGAQRRPFDDAYSSAVVAIDAETGKPRWVFQHTHHDVWDYDVPAQPTLIDWPVGGTVRKALISPGKRGEIFVLDRATGQPILPVEERLVPTMGHAPGERLSSTQPFSTGMPSFRGADLVESDMWGLTPLDQLWCRLKFEQSRYDGPLTPPGLKPWIESPGTIGGTNWGGVSVDPERMLLIANTNRIPYRGQLLTRKATEAMGIVPLPDVSSGVGARNPQGNTPFGALMGPFMSPLAVPCAAPPYGRLAAVDLRSGKLVWMHELGDARRSGPLGLHLGLPIPMGVPNLGGALTTRSGLIFVAAGTDGVLRAFDSRSGKLLWDQQLPAGSHSVPISYVAADGRQMILLSVGGSLPFGSGQADHIIAFALPLR
jgi:quinoprotein glucose dehydrogenase